MEQSRQALLEEEVLIVRHSGEIPEITLHSSLYYLCEDDQGPGLTLTTRELDLLYDAALTRFKEIMLRDLDPENRDKSIYRGVARSIVNRQRCADFCRRIGRNPTPFDEQVAQALLHFLQCELADVAAGRRISCLNCSREDLKNFAMELGIAPASLPPGWESLCPSEPGPSNSV